MAGGIDVPMILILRPDRKIAGKFHFIMKVATPPIQGEKGVVSRFCIEDILIIQHGAQPCPLPLERVG